MAARDYRTNVLDDNESEFVPASFTTSDEIPPIRHRVPSDGSSRLVVAIDYGTTFTGVAFAAARSENASLEDVRVITNWGPQMGNHDKIPSVISYSPASAAGEAQWGASISPEAVTMVNMKMELDVQDTKLDELELILRVLDGTSNLDFEAVKKARGYPEYTWKSPEEIVTDYLTQVFESVNQAFEIFGSHLKSQVQVDIVITVPVKWSYRAQNSTLRAIRAAGFNDKTFHNLNDIIVVPEPKAAAIYTARHLKEDKKTEFLKHFKRGLIANLSQLGECFVLCDAGGGTVDCIAYKVTQLEPTLELEEMTIATSGKCGSAFIDTNFKYWLRKVLSDRHYRTLDPKSGGQQIRTHTTEGKAMRQVIREFDAHKRAFSNSTQEVHFELPEGNLHRLNIPGKLREGELTISHTEMKGFFDPCVDEVVELIQGQIQQVVRKQYRVKNVFLVGGFGESPYLQEELRKSLKLRKITMRKPDTQKAWTAVVQGAVIYGIEKSHHGNVKLMSTCSKSYGVALNESYSTYKYDKTDQFIDPVTNNVMAQQQLTWLIRRGDLILSDTTEEKEKEFMVTFQGKDDCKFSLPIYEYPHEDDDVPDRFEIGQHELVKAALLNWDLSNIDLIEFDRCESPKTRLPYYAAYLKCRTILSGTSFEVELHWKDRKLCSVKLTDIEAESSRKSESANDSWWDEYRVHAGEEHISANSPCAVARRRSRSTTDKAEIAGESIDWWDED